MNILIYRTSDDVINSKVGDEVILLHTESDKAYGIDSTAAFIWALIEDGGKTREQIADALTNHFDVERKLALTDIDNLLEHFAREQLIFSEPAGTG